MLPLRQSSPEEILLLKSSRRRPALQRMALAYFDRSLPKDYLPTLLPRRNPPLQANGNGIQSIYLIEVSPPFAEVLASLIGREA